MKYLTEAQVLALHRQMVGAFGGADAVRDPDLLRSALGAPFQTFAGMPLHPGLTERAAHLGYGIIRNHPFADGNKRTGLHTMLVFLAVNGVALDYDAEAMTDLILRTAAGECTAEEICAFLDRCPRHTVNW